MTDNTNYYFFWHGPLSQWASFKMYDPLKDIEFNCCEQYMMYHKALLFNDKKRAEAILSSNNPKEQKGLGREVTPFHPKVWDAVKMELVWRGNYLKFSQLT